MINGPVGVVYFKTSTFHVHFPGIYSQKGITFAIGKKIYLYLQLTTINLRMMCTGMMNLFLSMKTGEAKIESQYELFVGLLF